MAIGNLVWHSGVINPEVQVRDPQQPVVEPRRERLVLVLQVAGLLLTGWVIFQSTLGLQWTRVPVPWLILRAAIYAVSPPALRAR